MSASNGEIGDTVGVDSDLRDTLSDYTIKIACNTIVAHPGAVMVLFLAI